MRIAFIVKHIHTGIWEFVMAEDREEARNYVFEKRKKDFEQYVREDGKITFDEVKESLEPTIVGEETRAGLYFYDSFVEL